MLYVQYLMFVCNNGYFGIQCETHIHSQIVVIDIAWYWKTSRPILRTIYLITIIYVSNQVA